MNTEWSLLINCFHLSEAGIDEPVFLDRSVGRSWGGKSSYSRWDGFVVMTWNSVSSTLSQISPRLGCSFEWNPAFMLLHMNDTSRCTISVCICEASQSGRNICKLCDDGCPEYGLNAVIAHSLCIGWFSWHTETVRMMLFIRDGIYHWKVLGERNFKYIQGGISEKTRSMSTSSMGVVLVRSLGLTQTISIFFAVEANIVSACPFLNSFQFVDPAVEYWWQECPGRCHRRM